MTRAALADGIDAHEQKLADIERMLSGLEARAEKVRLSRPRKPGLPAGNICRPWSSKRAFVKWAGPCFLVGCCGYIGSAGLHIASYNFVHEMNAWNHTVVDGAFKTQADRSLAHDVLENFSSIPDPIETNVFGPRVQIQMVVLDKMALVFPALFTVLVLYTGRSEVWAKVMLCTALLAACKGIIGALSTVPDSSGWEVCRDQHLGPDGYAFLSQDLSFWQIVTVDFWWFPHYHRPLRYCSDMMFSGHTFFVTLYALGLYEVALIFTSNWHPKKDTPKSRGRIVFCRALFLSLVGLAAIGQQAGEIYFVLLTRFHYSADVLVALLLTFLFYTNGAVCIAAKQWALRDVHFLMFGKGALSCSFGKNSNRQLMRWDDSRPSSLQKVEKTKYCCLGGISYANTPVANPPYDMKHDEKSITRRGVESWVSRGDVLVPWCCVPFCCLAGRQHIYSDSNLERWPTDSLEGRIFDHLHINEGISEKDVAHCWQMFMA